MACGMNLVSVSAMRCAVLVEPFWFDMRRMYPKKTDSGSLAPLNHPPANPVRFKSDVQVLRDSRGSTVPAFDRTLLLNLQKQRDKAPVFPT